VSYSHSGCIKLIFQPAYAPHLNASERLWGVLHREVTHNRFYQSFELFARAIDDFFQRRLPQEGRSWRDTGEVAAHIKAV
jgi:transposase